MKSKLSTKPYKGTRDFFPPEMLIHNKIFSTMERVVQSFGYEPYNGPMLESFDIYAAKSGEELVNEQLYHFEDRGGRKVAMRPEMTPTLARMVASKVNELPAPIRWYSMPNLWRYERPQRGRLREHWQLNVDMLGVDEMVAELEILKVSIGIMLALGAKKENFQIVINNRKLMNHIFAAKLELSGEQTAKVARVIDKKAKIPAEKFISELEDIGLGTEQIDFLNRMFDFDMEQLKVEVGADNEGVQELDSLFTMLEQNGLAAHCKLDLGIMRGLDYYTGMVFEMFDLHKDNRRALFGGGRYDGLISLFQAKPMSGVGFGMGDVTITNFLQTHDIMPEIPSVSEVLMSVVEKSATAYGEKIADRLRAEGIRIQSYFPYGEKMKKQMKFAHKKNIPYVIIVGSKEVDENNLTVKNMGEGTQVTVPAESIVSHLQDLLRL